MLFDDDVAIRYILPYAHTHSKPTDHSLALSSGFAMNADGLNIHALLENRGQSGIIGGDNHTDASTAQATYSIPSFLRHYTQGSYDMC